MCTVRTPVFICLVYVLNERVRLLPQKPKRFVRQINFHRNTPSLSSKASKYSEVAPDMTDNEILLFVWHISHLDGGTRRNTETTLKTTAID